MSKLSKGGLGTLIEGMVKLPQDGYSITIKVVTSNFFYNLQDIVKKNGK